MTRFSYQPVTWGAAADALCHIRREVFIQEQQISPELEWEHADKAAQHFLLSVKHAPDNAIGCARILRETHASRVYFHIGRVAVLANQRGGGAGTWFMRKLLAWCQQQPDYRHCQQVFLHAQYDVIPFYQRLNFTPHGDIFMDAGIRHRAMTWQGNA
jgi:predicted GNAT family N-acyltransferase